jgi:hypothetical protein
MKILKTTFLSLLTAGAAVLCMGGEAAAATLAAANCSYAAVSSAVASAAQGDTVTVPGGSCTWSSTLQINKGISLIGAGVGSTVITKGTSILIKYVPSNANANALIRISGFTFDHAGSGGTGLDMSSGNTLVLQTKMRIDNNRFQNIALGSSQDHYMMFAGMRGVVDSNQFGRVFYPMRAPFSPNPDGGKASWENHEGVVFGKADNNLFFEDNVFEELTDPSGPIVMDCQTGERYAFRYNTFNLAQSAYPFFDMHGNQASDFYACMGGEIYGNKLIGGGGTFLDQRGGRAFVFNNSTSASMSFQIREEFDDNNTPVVSGWQYPQHVSGSYYWGNRVGASGSLLQAFINDDCSQCQKNGLAAGVDFFTDSSSPGVGAGAPQNRPATCRPGQGYWATNQSVGDLSGMVGAKPASPISGTLYRCTANGAWDGGASPLPYPHPLRSGSSPTAAPQSVVLAPPAQLQVR